VTIDTFTHNKFAWLDQVQRDGRRTASAFELAFIISRYVNRETGDAWPAQETLAGELHASSRTVRGLLDLLVKNGHLEIVAGRGRGIVNHYRPVLQNRKPASAQEPENRKEASAFVAEENRKSASKKPEVSRQKTGSQLPTIPLIELSDETSEGFPPISPRAVAKPSKVKKQTAEPEGFGEFWSIYPRKIARGAARGAFSRALEKAPGPEIIAGARRYAHARKGEAPRFTKHPATWLRAEGWLDEPEPPGRYTGNGRDQNRQPQSLAKIAMGSGGQQDADTESDIIDITPEGQQ